MGREVSPKTSQSHLRLSNLRSILSTATNGGDVVRWRGRRFFVKQLECAWNKQYLVAKDFQGWEVLGILFTLQGNELTYPLPAGNFQVDDFDDFPVTFPVFTVGYVIVP